jgi:hypothetical protein
MIVDQRAEGYDSEGSLGIYNILELQQRDKPRRVMQESKFTPKQLLHL